MTLREKLDAETNRADAAEREVLRLRAELSTVTKREAQVLGQVRGQYSKQVDAYRKAYTSRVKDLPRVTNQLLRTVELLARKVASLEKVRDVVLQADVGAAASERDQEAIQRHNDLHEVNDTETTP